MPLFRTALVLGLLAAVGPFAIDMYLPALPRIGEAFGAEETAVQITLVSYFIAFGLSQLAWGPMADQVGRKKPIFFGVGIFMIGSAGCALAPSLGALAAFRCLQGVGAAVVMVVPRAIIRDMHTGPQATRLMAMVMLVISVSPMLAPLAGSGVLVVGTWRTIFWVLCGAAAISIVLTATALKETLPPERRTKVEVRSLMRGAKVLFSDPVFMGLTFIGGFGMASFFVFISSASFVYREQFGLSATGFSLAFAINAVGFFGASQAAGPLGEKLGLVWLMRRAIIGFATFTMTLFVVALLGGATLPVIIGLLFCGNACLGLVIPTTMVMALDDHGDIAGLASSLGGTLQMVTGGLMIVLAGPFFDGTATPMVGAIATCGVVTLLLSLAVMPRVQRRGQIQAA